MGRPALIALAAAAIVTTACSGGGHEAAPGATTSAYSIVVEPAEIDWSGPLPADVCYVAAASYEVDITSRSERRPDLCERLATKYLPREPRLGWPPPYLRDSDAAASVVCVLARGDERVEIDYGPADSGRIDAEGICDSLIGVGWIRRPPWEGLDGPWPGSD